MTLAEETLGRTPPGAHLREGVGVGDAKNEEQPYLRLQRRCAQTGESLPDPGTAIARQEMVSGAQAAKHLKGARRELAHGVAMRFQKSIYVVPEFGG